MKTYNLDFYYFDSCPFCQKVMRVIKDLDIKVTYKDIRKDQASLQKLMDDTGRRTVPCLYIDDKPMHESDDIISWLNDNKNDLAKN